MNNQEYNQEEALLKEALTQAKSDHEINMPDVEAELRKFHIEHDKKQFVRKNQSFSLKRVAAILLISVIVGGMTWAAYTISTVEVLPLEEVKDTVVAEQPIIQQVIEQPEQADSVPFLSYPKASLEQIIQDLSKHYGLGEPVFENPKSKEIVMHVTFNPDGKIQEALGILNHFGSVRFELKDNHIIVK